MAVSIEDLISFVGGEGFYRVHDVGNLKTLRVEMRQKSATVPVARVLGRQGDNMMENGNIVNWISHRRLGQPSFSTARVLPGQKPTATIHLIANATRAAASGTDSVVNR